MFPWIVKILLSFILLLINSNLVYSNEFQYSLGLTYVSGLRNIEKQYKKNKKNEAYINVGGDYDIPIGISFNSYTDVFNLNLFNTIVGCGIGPFTMGINDIEYSDIPVHLYTKIILYDEKIDNSLYFRFGLTKHFIHGRYIENTDSGLLFGFGIEDKKIGIEISYDTTEIKMKNITGLSPHWLAENIYSVKKEFIKPVGLMFSINFYLE